MKYKELLKALANYDGDWDDEVVFVAFNYRPVEQEKWGLKYKVTAVGTKDGECRLNNLYDDICDAKSDWEPCTDENYWSEEGNVVTLVRVPDDGGHFYIKDNCPYGWNVLVRMGAQKTDIKWTEKRKWHTSQ